MNPYATGAPVYGSAGYTGIFPVNGKLPALKNVTGREGVQTTPGQYAAAGPLREHGQRNIGWRLPDGVVGVDVDTYDAKSGSSTLERLTASCGPLPATWTSTSRGAGQPSRIHFYRVPEGVRLQGIASARHENGTVTADIEIIQHHHRYAVVWPSVHPGHGGVYRWYDPSGAESEAPPAPAELPELPGPWLDYLRAAEQIPNQGKGATEDEFLDRHTDAGQPRALRAILGSFTGVDGSRHDTMFKALHWAAREAAAGAFTAEQAFTALRGAWDDATGGEGRAEEFEAMLTAACAAVSDADIERTRARLEQHNGGAAAQDIPSPDNPMAVARALLPAWEHNGLPTLRNWRGQWMRWEGPYWAEIDDAAMKADLYPQVEHAAFTTLNKEGEPKVIPWAPNRRKIADLLEAVAAVTHLDSSTDAPTWLDGRANRNVVACRNGVLNIRTRELSAPTPAFFNLVSSPLDYDPKAPEPAEWLKFLGSLWQDDEQAVALLQEWFGYILSGRTDLQKALLLVGERRSGKGTIARILTALIGKGHVASPTLASMATNFGLSTLIGTPLAIIGDARVPRQGSQQVVERLLSITGEDSLDVDRKYRDLWTGRLPSRIMILSNDLPSFADASGAVASRLVILTLTRSFLGREDTGLEQRLTAELPGILTWALEGLDSLTRRGRFAEPESSATATALLAESVSPIRAFLDECCVKGPEHSVAIKTLYAAWRVWCEQTGRDHPGTEATFGAKLFSAVPALRRVRTRLPDGSRPWAYSGVAIGNAPRPAGCTCTTEPNPWCSVDHGTDHQGPLVLARS